MSISKSSHQNSSLLPSSLPPISEFRWADELDMPTDEILLRIRYED